MKRRYFFQRIAAVIPISWALTTEAFATPTAESVMTPIPRWGMVMTYRQGHELDAPLLVYRTPVVPLTTKLLVVPGSHLLTHPGEGYVVKHHGELFDVVCKGLHRSPIPAVLGAFTDTTTFTFRPPHIFPADITFCDLLLRSRSVAHNATLF